MSYRDDEVGLRAHRDALLADRRDETRASAFATSGAPSIFARRAARVAGGVVAIAGALAMTLTAICTRGIPWLLGVEQAKPSLTPILFVTALAAPLVALVVRLSAGAFARRIAARMIAQTDDVRTDVARLAERSAASLFAEWVDRLEVRSVWLPLAGAALVVPLTLHLAFAWIVSSSQTDLTSDFDVWILLSLVLTIPAHGVLALLAVRFAKKLRAWREGERRPSAWAPLLWTIVAGCVPGIVLYLIPPILVAVTGLFVPIAFSVMRARVLDERAKLAALV
ncbi:MAG TPA: hypothetical protein VIF62_35335 [Labilithrix sp.]